jgi:hypothetical protein
MFRSPFLMTDPGNAGTITVDRYGAVVPVVTTTTETITLAVPTKAGLTCTVVLDTDGGDLTLTVTSGYNADGDTSITFADAGDFVTFISVKIGANYRWRVLAHEGTNVAGENLTVDNLTATDLTLNGVAVDTADMTPGTGISTGTGTICEHRVTKFGTIIKTEILIDLTGLNSSAAADVIGKQATANCHIGQVTAAVNGTIFAGRMSCLETPVGGEPDIDLYTSDVATGTEDVAITHADLGTEAAILDAAADWTATMAPKGFTANPAANQYLYLVGSGGGTDQIYTAGILLIEMWGQ